MLARVAFESSSLKVAELELLQSRTPGLSWVSTTSVVESQRQVKDKEEIQQIREAVRLAERVFEMVACRLAWRPVRAGRGGRDRIPCPLVGGEGCSFPPIVAAGERSALPHASPSSQRLDASPTGPGRLGRPDARVQQ